MGRAGQKDPGAHAAFRGLDGVRARVTRDQTCRSTIIFLISAMALAGFNPLGQVLVQFMIVRHDKWDG